MVLPALPVLPHLSNNEQRMDFEWTMNGPWRTINAGIAGTFCFLLNLVLKTTHRLCKVLKKSKHKKKPQDQNTQALITLVPICRYLSVMSLIGGGINQYGHDRILGLTKCFFPNQSKFPFFITIISTENCLFRGKFWAKQISGLLPLAPSRSSNIRS